MPENQNGKITIWGRTTSLNVQKVLWAADALGLSYDRIDCGGAFGGNSTPDYLAMNPNGLIPVLRDTDGSVHWESNSILRYLAAKHGQAPGGGLWPADPAMRSLADRWMDWTLTMLDKPMVVLLLGLIREPAKADLNELSKAEVQLADYWTRLDRHLADRNYVAGDRLTLGDIPVGCQVQRYFGFPITRPDLPHLTAWHERLKQAPGYRQHVMIPLT